MRTELKDFDLDKVAGGNYYLNKNNMKLAFTTLKGQVFQLHDCKAGDAEEIMDALIGKYATVAEYDQACVAALEQQGWIDRIQ